MRVFLNYQKEDKPMLPLLTAMLKSRGVTFVAAAANRYEMGQLIQIAKDQACEAIILCNSETLNYCVASSNPSLDNFRGSRLNFSVPVIVINKLSHIHAIPHGKWLLEQDLNKLLTLNVPALSFTYKLLEDRGAFAEALRYLQTCMIIVHDVETTPVKTNDAELLEGIDDPEARDTTGMLTCFSYTGIAHDLTHRTYVIPLVDFGVPHYADDATFIAAIEFLQSVNALTIPKCAHNGTYDACYDLIYHAPLELFLLDTMILWQSWHQELPKSLDFVASVCLYDSYQWKGEAQAAVKHKDKVLFWGYSGKDTWNTARILLWIIRNAPPYVWNNYKKTFPKVYPCIYTAFEGFAVDYERRKTIRTESVKSLIQAKHNLTVMAADPKFNPGSPKQVAEFLYNIIGAKKLTKRIGGELIELTGTDEKVLAQLAMQHPLIARLAGDILDYRGAKKAISTYFDFSPTQKRIFWSIIVGGTETNRYSCVGSFLFSGLQIQNVPGKDSKSGINAKGMLMADPGYELIELDHNKAEARVIAYVFQCVGLIEALNDPDREFYKILATIFFGMKYEEVTKDLRNNVVKRIIHGTNYLMQEDTFIDTATPKRLYEAAALLHYKLTTLKAFATFLLEIYHVKFPEIRQGYKVLQREVAATGKLVSMLGYTREFFGDPIKDKKVLKNMVAHTGQNLNADIINEGYEKIFWQVVVPSEGAVRLKAQIHDSILVQAVLDWRMQYIEKAHALTHHVVDVHGRSLTIPRDFKVGIYWDEMEEVKYEPR